MSQLLHKALAEVIPHVDEGCQIFVIDSGEYHRFRVSGGEICHTGSHSESHVERGRGSMEITRTISP